MEHPGQILLVSENFPPAVGGTAVLFDNVYRRIPDCSVEVWTDEVASAGPAEEFHGPFSIRRYPLRTPHWGLLDPSGWRHHLGAAWRLRRRAPKGSIVHTGRALPEGIWAYLSRRMGGPPYVCWAHGEEIRTARTSRDQLFTTRRVFRGARACIANSHNTAELVKEDTGLPESRVHVIHPGTDPMRFHPDVDGSALRQKLAGPDELLLLTVGRLQKRKGQDMTLRALARLGDRHRLRYALVGGGEEEQLLRRLAAELGVADRVTFLGKIPDDDLPKCYAACDIFLMPNRMVGEDIEGFGIVFLEAQATARPVIAGRSGGAPEAVREDETALLVDGEDVDDLARAIDRLASSLELRRRFGAAGRRLASEHYSWEHAARKLAGIPELLAASNR